MFINWTFSPFLPVAVKGKNAPHQPLKDKILWRQIYLLEKKQIFIILVHNFNQNKHLS